MLSDPQTTINARLAVATDDIVAEAQLLQTAERALEVVGIESSVEWKNLAIIAQISRIHNSPALATARAIAVRNSDHVATVYDRALRDMVLVESDEPVDLIRGYLEIPDPVGYYVAKRTSHIAAEHADVRTLRGCAARLASFNGLDSPSGSPQLNWLITKALFDRAVGRSVDRAGLCATIRATKCLWRRYCREITAVLGRENSTVCAACVAKMSGVPQLGD